jgi:hypothetical protein
MVIKPLLENNLQATQHHSSSWHWPWYTGMVSEGFSFFTLTKNHILCQIKFQQSVN